jgi:hypothetical protein
MDSAIFEDLQRTLTKSGANAAIEQLCTALRERKDYNGYFYALLLKKRHELGLSPVPSGASSDIPEKMQAPYEDAIREAARLVGKLYLEQGDIGQAFVYFRMIGELEPVTAAIEKYQPGESDDVQQVVEIAFHHGVSPKKGFDLLLQRFGLCSAITTASSGEYQHGADVRTYCIQRLVQALYDELKVRLTAEITQKEGTAPTETSVRDLIRRRDWLFEDDFYHIDVSHLSSVVQMSMHLPAGPDLEMARELAEYGRKLSPRYQYASDPPFENQYQDYSIYLDTIAGVNVDEGVNHFRSKLENADPDSIGTAPAEILVNLLVRLNRPAEALTIARKYLSQEDGRGLSCPSVTELCEKAKDYGTLTEVARERGDSVHFLAGLLAGNGKKK